MCELDELYDRAAERCRITDKNLIDTRVRYGALRRAESSRGDVTDAETKQTLEGVFKQLENLLALQEADSDTAISDLAKLIAEMAARKCKKKVWPEDPIHT